jgi:proline dehydrogenase
VVGETRIKEILEECDPINTGYMDYITWAKMLSPRDLPKVVKSCGFVRRLSQVCPTHEEIELLDAMFNRGRILCEEAARTGTRLLVDAEQYKYQHAIDNLVLELQKRFNSTDVADKPVIYNTYQCYRKDTPQRLRTDVDRSERYNYHFGAKLVRGAYMERERSEAKKNGIPDPIHDSIFDTHTCYDESVEYILHHSSQSDKKVELMCATHNQTSIVKAIDSMNRHGIDRRDSTICFGQLYGMSDHLTFNLGSHGYRAFKYVPYGEVHEAIQYLLRRARENASVLGGAKLELDMIQQELPRRFFQNY